MRRAVWAVAVAGFSCLAGLLLWPPITSDLDAHVRLTSALVLVAGAASVVTFKVGPWGVPMSALPFMLVILRPLEAEEDALWFAGWIWLCLLAAVAAAAGWLISFLFIVRSRRVQASLRR